MTKEKLLPLLLDATKEMTEDGLRDWILKAERIDFEYLITFLNNQLEISFYYRENNGGSDYRGELYIQKQMFIDENEKYRADIYIDIDFNFSNDLDEFIDEVIRADEKAKSILFKLEN